MKKPFLALKIKPENLSITELKTYLKVLQDRTTWNSNLIYFVGVGEIVPEQEIVRVKGLLGRNN